MFELSRIHQHLPDILDRSERAFDDAWLDAFVRGKSVLVTGAAGSVGAALSRRLACAGARRLILLDSHEPSLFRVRAELLSKSPERDYRWVLADTRDEPKMRALFISERPNVVFHLAAYKHVPLAEENVDQAIAVNLLASVALHRAASDAGVDVFVYPSTDKAVHPPSIYGATKRLFERYALSRVGNGQTTIGLVRLVNVMGSQGSVLETFARLAGEGRPLTVTDVRMTRYWMTMKEAVSVLLGAAAGIAPRDGVMVVDTGPAIPLVDVATRLATLVRPEQPANVLEIGIRPGERLYEELAYPYEEWRESRERYVKSLRNGLHLDQQAESDTVEWFQSEFLTADQADLRARLFSAASA